MDKSESITGTLIADLQAFPLGSVELESELSHCFAAAASCAGAGIVRLFLRLHHDSVTSDDTLECSNDTQKRKDRDILLRGVDRCQQRIHPPLDPLQYLSLDSPNFNPTVREGEKELEHSVLFLVRPFSSTVTGGDKRGLWGGKHLADGVTPRYSVVLGSEIGHSLAEQPGALWTEGDEALWRLTRATRTQQEDSVSLRSGSLEGAVSQGSSPPLHEKVDPVKAMQNVVNHATQLQRFQWRCASWTAERLVNEAHWAKPVPAPTTHRRTHHSYDKAPSNPLFTAPVHADIFLAAQAMPTKRILHADVRGIECVLYLLGTTSRYAYLGTTANGQPSDSSWIFLGRIPVPTGLSITAVPLNSRKRNRSEALEWLSLVENAEDAMKFDEQEHFHWFPPSERRLITCRAHRVSCTCSSPQRTPSNGSASLSFLLEDCYLIDPPQRDEDLERESAAESLEDIKTLIRRSCQRFIETGKRLMEKVEAAEAEKNSLEGAPDLSTTRCAQEGLLVRRACALFHEMSDATAVHFKKIRGGKNSRAKAASPIPTIKTHRDVEGLLEGATVEFKYRLHFTAQGEEGKGEDEWGTATPERLRHTLVSMANTLGGVVIVGVTDDGRVVGHPHPLGEVKRQLRLTGFCPAMVKDSISLRELPVLSSGPAHGSDAVKLKPNWWKSGEGLSTGVITTANAQAGAATPQRYITVITVQRGLAPYYCVTSQAGIPYKRGCASTTPMSVWLMASRLFAYLQ